VNAPPIPVELQSIVDLLPAPVIEVRLMARVGQPWFVRYGSQRAVLRWNDPKRFPHSDLAMESIAWLHAFLSDLAQCGFRAPAPLPHLRGESIAKIDGAIWELLTFVPGQSIGWADATGLFAAGRALAQFHEASIALPGRAQRPLSLPLSECRPGHPAAQSILVRFKDELAEIDYSASLRVVVHGDATNANVVDDGSALRFVDFALAYREALLFDIGSALWRNGRPSAEAVTYDGTRMEHFVRGYASHRSLAEPDCRAIVVYLKGRGLQLQHRLELRRGVDDTVMQRLLAVQRQQAELEKAIGKAIG